VVNFAGWKMRPAREARRIAVPPRVPEGIKETDMSRSVAAAAAIVLCALATPARAAEVFVTVSTTSASYSPALVYIQPGDTVTWQYAGGAMPHDVHADDNSYSNTLSSAPWTFSVTFPVATTSRYYCTAHGAPGGVGMSGMIVVGGREAWAPSEIAYTLSAWDFVPRTTAMAWGSATTPAFHRTGSAAGEDWIAGLPLPSGAQIAGLEVAGCDNGAGTLNVMLFECIDPDGPCDLVAIVTPSGTPPCAYTSVRVPPPSNVNNLANSYVVEARLGAAQSLRSVRVFYKKQVSPAPATATFADVPTTDGRFRFVEALAAAGITGGCGGGNFCPDSPVTRGQMAVFLSVALGLFWPN
jgi:plastocyanin